jgi:hypothetical protein
MQDILKLKVVPHPRRFSVADLVLERRYTYGFRSEDDDASSTIESQSEHGSMIEFRPELMRL